MHPSAVVRHRQPSTGKQGGPFRQRRFPGQGNGPRPQAPGNRRAPRRIAPASGKDDSPFMPLRQPPGQRLETSCRPRFRGTSRRTGHQNDVLAIRRPFGANRFARRCRYGQPGRAPNAFRSRRKQNREIGLRLMSGRLLQNARQERTAPRFAPQPDAFRDSRQRRRQRRTEGIGQHAGPIETAGAQPARRLPHPAPRKDFGGRFMHRP